MDPRARQSCQGSAMGRLGDRMWSHQKAISLGHSTKIADQAADGFVHVHHNFLQLSHGRLSWISHGAECRQAQWSEMSSLQTSRLLDVPWSFSGRTLLQCGHFEKFKSDCTGMRGLSMLQSASLQNGRMWPYVLYSLPSSFWLENGTTFKE